MMRNLAPGDLVKKACNLCNQDWPGCSIMNMMHWKVIVFWGGHIVLQRFVHVRCHFQPLPTKLVFAYFILFWPWLICIWVDVISTFTVYTQYEWRSISLYTPLEDFPTVPNHQAGQQAPKSHRQPVSTIKTIASGTASLACAYSAVVPARNPQTSVVGVEGNGKIWSPTPKRFKDEGLSSNSYDLDGPPPSLGTVTIFITSYE